MAQNKPFTVDALWQLERLASLSLAPDGRQAVVSLTTSSMTDNRSTSRLLLLSTEGRPARELTTAGERDGQPRWSPRGDRIAFLARREQQGDKDETTQIYLIAPDGGEARRAASVATGVEALRWCPDGARIVFISWVWPEVRGAQAQAKRLKAWQARKETGVVTDAPLYRWWDRMLPPGRVPHLHLLDLRSGRVRDLFEDTPYALSRIDPDANDFDVSPDGQRIVFAWNPAPVEQLGDCGALVELDLASGRFDTLVQADGWDCQAPRYSPDGGRIAFIATNTGVKHTLPPQLAVWQRESGAWQVESAAWDHRVEAPLLWEDDGQALLFGAEQRGRRHLWRFDLPDRRAEIVPAGNAAGWVTAFDKAAGTTVLLAEALTHPAQAWALLPGRAPRRIERCNDALLQRHHFGRHEVVPIRGADGDPVDLWLIRPPGFDPARRHPVLLLLHGGPHSAYGDNWQLRWNQQVLAAPGCVIACLNYHGSSGYGQAFLDAITHRWGELELQDIAAATDWLRAQPWVDAGRIHAGGGSYGGYLVALLNGRQTADPTAADHAAPGHTSPGRYASLVCHAGCWDWGAMFADDAYRWHWQGLGASYWEQPERVAAQSPHSHAGAMATPTLISHGALDYRVPDAQGLAHYNTLKARGVEARLLWFPDEHHWIVKPCNSRLWYREVLAWLQAHYNVVGATPERPRTATSS